MSSGSPVAVRAVVLQRAILSCWSMWRNSSSVVTPAAVDHRTVQDRCNVVAVDPSSSSARCTWPVASALSIRLERAARPRTTHCGRVAAQLSRESRTSSPRRDWRNRPRGFRRSSSTAARAVPVRGRVPRVVGGHGKTSGGLRCRWIAQQSYQAVASSAAARGNVRLSRRRESLFKRLDVFSCRTTPCLSLAIRASISAGSPFPRAAPAAHRWRTRGVGPKLLLGRSSSVNTLRRRSSAPVCVPVSTWERRPARPVFRSFSPGAGSADPQESFFQPFSGDIGCNACSVAVHNTGRSRAAGAASASGTHQAMARHVPREGERSRGRGIERSVSRRRRTVAGQPPL